MISTFNTNTKSSLGVGVNSSFPIFLLILIIAASGYLMMSVSREESAIMDELAHIPAGYSYVKYLDYRLNPEHPPLLKALAGLPLLGLNLKFPTDNENWTQKLNSQWDMGSLFLYHSGNDADQIIQTARIFPIILTLLTIILIYIWSRELFGKWWGLLPAFLFGLSPSVLAHGHYVTTDIAAAFGFLLAAYLFIKFLNGRSRKNLIWAGAGLGIALLLKFSTVLLFPLFFIILFFFWLGECVRKKTSGIGDYNFRYFAGRAVRHIGDLILIFLIAFAVVYAVYFIFTFNYPPARQLSDTSEILKSFQPPWLGQFNIGLAKNNFTRPIAQYLLGVLMVLQRSAGGNTSYFLGDVSNAGWHYYFPVVFILKEPLPSLILIFFALILGLKNIITKTKGWKLIRKFSEYLGTNLTEFSLLVLVLVYWAYSLNSTLNIGFRHLFPILPLMYMLAASGFKNWLSKSSGHSLKYGLLILIIVWFAGEAFAAYPYYLSYFNEIGGGTKNGYRYAVDSNYDWGQDLKRLKQFVENPPVGGPIKKIAVDYFGGGDPKYYLGQDIYQGWHSSNPNPKDRGIEWLAVSAEFLQNTIQPADKTIERKPGENYEWLRESRPAAPGMGNLPPPDFRAGTSIFIYRL